MRLVLSQIPRKPCGIAISAAFLVLAGGSGVSTAASIVQNFEGSSAGSGTPPAGWSLVTEAGSPTYATSSAGAGSDGAGSSSGLGGRVFSSAFVVADHPGAYLVNSIHLAVTTTITGSFDFLIVTEGSFDDAVFVIGDVANGITGSSNGELLSVKFYEGADQTLNDGTGADTRLDAASISGLANDTWYRASFTWTPTSGTTGDFSITVNDFSSNLYTLSTTGFAFDVANAQVGFGSVNDTMIFDNVSIADSIPEPSSVLLSVLGVGLLLRRRRVG